MSVTHLDLDEIERLTNAATPGPWKLIRTQGGDDEIRAADPDDPGETLLVLWGAHDTLGFRSCDLPFVLTAREAVPKLVARVRELEAQIALSKRLARVSCCLPESEYVAVDGEEITTGPPRYRVMCVAHGIVFAVLRDDPRFRPWDAPTCRWCAAPAVRRVSPWVPVCSEHSAEFCR